MAKFALLNWRGEARLLFFSYLKNNPRPVRTLQRPGIRRALCVLIRHASDPAGTQTSSAVSAINATQ
jgi:hypothetical protein